MLTYFVIFKVKTIPASEFRSAKSRIESIVSFSPKNHENSSTNFRIILLKPTNLLEGGKTK